MSVTAIADELQIPRIVRFVDLDAPGALETVQRDHPEHVADIQRILIEAPDQPPELAPGWMRTQFGATASGYGMIFKTSDPPKAQFCFVLGDTYYRTLIILRNVHPEVTFPKNSALPTNSATQPDAREASHVCQLSQPRAAGRER